MLLSLLSDVLLDHLLLLFCHLILPSQPTRSRKHFRTLQGDRLERLHSSFRRSSLFQSTLQPFVFQLFYLLNQFCQAGPRKRRLRCLPRTIFCCHGSMPHRKRQRSDWLNRQRFLPLLPNPQSGCRICTCKASRPKDPSHNYLLRHRSHKRWLLYLKLELEYFRVSESS